jgi:nucleotide-binding universal stress UspA family protein
VLVAAAWDGEAAPVDELDDVLGRLQRHGVAARTVALTAPEDPGPALMDFARREGADLIVAGAYGSGRVQEWAFGGVTQALLERATQFVLFSH